VHERHEDDGPPRQHESEPVDAKQASTRPPRSLPNQLHRMQKTTPKTRKPRHQRTETVTKLRQVRKS
jgi:hypothetical protein